MILSLCPIWGSNFKTKPVSKWWKTTASDRWKRMAEGRACLWPWAYMHLFLAAYRAVEPVSLLVRIIGTAHLQALFKPFKNICSHLLDHLVLCDRCESTWRVYLLPLSQEAHTSVPSSQSHLFLIFLSPFLEFSGVKAMLQLMGSIFLAWFICHPIFMAVFLGWASSSTEWLSFQKPLTWGCLLPSWCHQSLPGQLQVFLTGQDSGVWNICTGS